MARIWWRCVFATWVVSPKMSTAVRTRNRALTSCPGRAKRDPGHERYTTRAKSRLAHEPLAVAVFTMSNSYVSSFPRRVAASGFCPCDRVHPRMEGVGGAPTGALSLLSRLRDATGRASEARRVPRRGTLASRRSTVAIFGRGPRFHLRHCLRIRPASSSQPGRHAWRAVSRTSRARSYEPRPQDATPRSAYRIVSRRRPSMSEDGIT